MAKKDETGIQIVRLASGIRSLYSNRNRHPLRGRNSMTRKTPKTAVVAFKVEEELAEFLNKLPNKSAFIRKAIAAQMSMACPLCNGGGMVSRGVHDHYAPLLKDLASRGCDSCGDRLPVPSDPGDLAPE